jgi:DNA-binding CsgD family transcriptional regulator/tetratricopeptide (TPR) repeat protein
MTGGVTSASFVGREDELSRLHGALRSAAAGTPGILLVGGEAGVGKTRLLQEFARRARDEAEVLLGSCVNVSGGGLPYGPIVDALRALTRTLGPVAQQEQLSIVLGDLTNLASATEQPPAQSRAELVGEYARARLFELVLRFLDRLGEQAPVVMVLEDLQWADRSTLDLLVFLARVVRQERLLLVATYRSDELPTSHPLHAVVAELDRNRRVEHLQLPRFDREEVAALLRGILGGPPPPETIDQIFVQSEGNAFFAEELIATTSRQSDPHRSSRLQGVLLARIAPLLEDTRHVLRLTATVRRPVAHHLLAAASQLAEERLLAAIREAVDRQVLLSEQDAYAFRHVLLQEAVYGQSLPGERQRLHRAVARVLAQDPLAASQPGAAVELSHHWYAAHDYPQALLASIAAARAAADVYGFTEAHHQYERALTLWNEVPDAQDQAGVALSELRLEAAEAARWAGLPDRAASLIQETLADLGGHIELGRAGLLWARLAECRSEAGNSKAALAAYEEASRLVANEPASAQKARVLAGHGTELMRQAQYSASRAHCEQAIAVARAVGARAAEGRALNTFGCDLAALGDPEAGIAVLRQALTLIEAAGSFDDIHRVYLNLSVILDLDAGRPEDGLEVARRGLERMRELGLELALPSNTLRINLAWGLWDLGRWQEAEQLVSEALTRALPATWALELQLLAGRLHIARGRFDLAHEQGQSTAQLVEQLNDPLSHAFLQRYLADLAVWQGDYDSARSAVAKALQQLADTEEHVVAVRLCCTGLRATADLAQRAHDRRARPSELTELYATGQQLLAHARQSLAMLGGKLSDVRANAAACEAEFTRLELRSDSQQWAALAGSWDALSRPYEAAYARWRQAEALLASKAPKAAAGVLRQGHRATIQLGERPLRHEIERLAQRTRIDLQPPGTEVKPAVTTHVTKHGLTPREQEVLRHLVEGRTNRQIARALFISEKTASVHVSNIMSKLDAPNRSTAAAIAHRLRLLEPNA